MKNNKFINFLDIIPYTLKSNAFWEIFELLNTNAGS